MNFSNFFPLNSYNNFRSQSGSIMVVAMVATSLFIIIFFGAIGLAVLQQKLNLIKVSQTQALHIAEAGVNYYRWVLYHDNEEYCNKETCLPGPDYGPYGPYSYTDSGGNNITGYYELYITPPPTNGSTIVGIKSVGYMADNPNSKRTIEVQCGIPAWSSYSTLANETIRFGEGTEVWGPMHSNGGIRFDGVTHNIITSSLADYDDPDHSGFNEFGVHTHVTPTDPLPDGNNPPGNIPIRTDVFMAGRSFPEPIISFDLLNNYISETYSKATTSGIEIDPSSAALSNCISSWCDEGFHISLKTDNTFDIVGVSSLKPHCSNASHSIGAESAWNANYPIPANGIIFVKHNVWVDGQIDNARVTILAFEDPFVGGTTDININNDLLYTNYDGQDAIGLIAQNDINVGQYSENDLRIDAALIAKEGRIGREYYSSSCTDYKRDTIAIYGSMATRKRYGFRWTSGGTYVSGYDTRNLIYDSNLTFAPPPHFPTTGEYTFISWNEN